VTGEHTLRIRCPTWGHLENFYSAKVKHENLLLARVPFSPSIGSVVTIALELPDGLVINIEADVEAVRKAPDGKKSAIRMVLRKMEAVRPRLERAVALGREDSDDDAEPVAMPSVPRTRTGLLVPIPSDVPIDEPVVVVRLPAAEDVPEDARERYRELESTLAAMREKAAHDVLGVDWDAEVSDIRLAYFGLVKLYHPDVLSKHGSDAVSLLGAEIFIYINKAYDRLRDSAVAAGKAIAAGPALLPSSGWIADFDDIGIARPRKTHRITDFASPVPVPVKAMSSLAVNAPEIEDNVEVNFSASAASDESKSRGDEAPSASQLEQGSLFVDARNTVSGMRPIEDSSDGGDEDAEADVDVDVLGLSQKALANLDAKKYDEAREQLAKVLEHEPRNREARALYHVAYGHTLIERGNASAAMTQFEVALKHDPDCEAAKAARSLRGSSKRKSRPSLLKRIFKR
jgi:tetratricopeptide (TPR) repeat protein